ncbi:MAG: general secretion pathway protein GspK [Chthoniobacterales bacterium]
MHLRQFIPKRKDRGAAIMLALWALFLLSAMIISWALDIDTRLTIAGSANRSLEAIAMACSGAEVALHPAVKPGLPVLRGNFPPNQSYEARITGEGGRLNLNKLTLGENPVYRELLRRYLEVKGVDLNDRDHMLDCLWDWVDPDNLVRQSGAEDEPGYKPPNGPLKSLDELKRIRGWEEFTARPDWDADFTMNSQDAKVDINWASRDVLLSLPGADERLVDRLMSARRGPDDIEGTDDDVKFTSVQELVVLGFSQNLLNQLGGLITFNDPFMRIISVGKSGTKTRTVQFVVFKQSSAIRLIPGTWKEF